MGQYDTIGRFYLFVFLGNPVYKKNRFDNSFWILTSSSRGELFFCLSDIHFSCKISDFESGKGGSGLPPVQSRERPRIYPRKMGLFKGVPVYTGLPDNGKQGSFFQFFMIWHRNGDGGPFNFLLHNHMAAPSADLCKTIGR